jgi:hypothetical protein
VRNVGDREAGQGCDGRGTGRRDHGGRDLRIHGEGKAWSSSRLPPSGWAIRDWRNLVPCRVCWSEAWVDARVHKEAGGELQWESYNRSDDDVKNAGYQQWQECRDADRECEVQGQVGRISGGFSGKAKVSK